MSNLMTDTTDMAALKINTYSVNSNDAWPQCADDDRTGSYVKWEDLVKLLSDKSQGKDPETGFDSLKNLKFVADCCIEKPDSIYASEFFLLLDEMFGKQGDYSMPVQAVAVSHLIGLLKAERQRAERGEAAAGIIQQMHNELKGERVPVALTVWYGSMPESNGKENWTAILHRKGVCISEGITVDRSEYPERVRYAADCMRYLIGEIQDEPDILAYDAGKRSDYVYPVTAPQKPVVLPKSHYVCGCADRFMSAPEVIAAIEAAGGIVKGGE